MSLIGFLEGVASLLTASANPNQRLGDSAKIYIEKKEKNKPLFNNWVSFPWKDINAVNRLKKSEFGRQMITELLFLGRKLKKVNMMAEFPGVPTLPGFSKTPERQWAPKPVSEEDWAQGKHALRLEFLDSPRTTLVIGNPSNRTIRVGNQRQVQCGGYASFVNLTQDYRALEESQEFHLGHRVKHFRGLKPLELKKASAKWVTPNALVADALKEPLTQKPDAKILRSVLGELKYEEEIGKRPLAYHLETAPDSKSPEQDDRDEVRDQKKFRGQEWNRYETVYRVEAVGIDFANVFDAKTGKLIPSTDATYGGDGNMAGAPNQTPVLSTDSPQALFEVRAKDFSTITKDEGTTDATASIICATPAFVLCGMTNPNDEGDISEFYSESSAFKWSKGDEEKADDDNFFAVRNKKNLTSNWNNILPRSLSESSVAKLPIADYGILGSKYILYQQKKLAGLELFGREGLLLGAGVKKPNNTWSTGLFLGKDHIKLSKESKGENGGSAGSSILIDGLKLSIESGDHQANKYASLEISPKDIDLTVMDEKGKTGIRIENNQVTVWVKGKKVFIFDGQGAGEPKGTIQYRL